jgi:hypothetical protein
MSIGLTRNEVVNRLHPSRFLYENGPPPNIRQSTCGIVYREVFVLKRSLGHRDHMVRFALPIPQESTIAPPDASKRNSQHHNLKEKLSITNFYAVWIIVAVVVLAPAAFFLRTGTKLTDKMVYAVSTATSCIARLPGLFDSGFVFDNNNLPLQEPAFNDVLDTRIRLALEERRLRTDFALQTNGGKIICEITTGCYMFPFHIPGVLSSPERAITDRNDCWSPQTLPGQIGIQLATSIHPTHVTVDAEFLGNSSPSIMLWGLLDGSDNEDLYRNALGELPDLPISRERPGLPPPWSKLSKFVFIPLAYTHSNTSSGAKSQTIPVLEYIQASWMTFSIVALEILDMQKESQLCISRVRVHGDIAITSGNNEVSQTMNFLLVLLTDTYTCSRCDIGVLFYYIYLFLAPLVSLYRVHNQTARAFDRV